MTPGFVSKRVVADRIEWITHMLHEIRALPLQDQEAFFTDSRNLWTAESCLRRALEALFDLARHILAKGLGVGVSEYKEIAMKLGDNQVLSYQDAQLLGTLAGYRNRLVHFYHEVGSEELYLICRDQLGDLEKIVGAFKAWLKNNPDRMDQGL